jgi:hypothetical protein
VRNSVLATVPLSDPLLLCIYFKVSVFEDVLDVFLLGYFAKKKNETTLCVKRETGLSYVVLCYLFLFY